MTVEELRNVFKPQLDTGYPHLFYMLSDHSKEPPLKVYKISECDIESLIPKLAGYGYTGIYSNMPRFAR